VNSSAAVAIARSARTQGHRRSPGRALATEMTSVHKAITPSAVPAATGRPTSRWWYRTSPAPYASVASRRTIKARQIGVV